MLRPPPGRLADWLRFHFRVGIGVVYLFLDDATDATSAEVARRIAAEEGARVDVTYTDAADGYVRYQGLQQEARLRPLLEHSAMARIRLNADVALRMAAAEGVDWLLHLDDDELFVVDVDGPAPARRFFGWLSEHAPRAEQAIFLNLEAVPSTLEVPGGADRLFREVGLFKRNPHALTRDSDAACGEGGCIRRWRGVKGKYSQGYSVGKSAVRPGVRGAFAADVTMFSTPGGGGAIAVFDGPVVLHYHNVGFELFVKKYAVGGSSRADPLNGLDFQKYVQQQLGSSRPDREAVRELYRRVAIVEEEAELPAELAAQMLLRFTRPALVLNSTSDGSAAAEAGAGDGDGDGDGDGGCDASEASAAARGQLVEELSGLRLSQLRRRAVADGVNAELVDDAEDGDEPKKALTRLIIARFDELTPPPPPPPPPPDPPPAALPPSTPQAAGVAHFPATECMQNGGITCFTAVECCELVASSQGRSRS